MGWFGKMTLGSLGFLAAGPLGAIAGVALGHHLFDKDGSTVSRSVPFGQVEQTQTAYFVSLFPYSGNWPRRMALYQGKN